MKKEILFAVAIGLLLGLAVTYGVYRAQKADTLTSTQVINTTDLATPTPGDSTLVLHAPEDESVQTDTALTVAGTTKPNLLVVILINDDEIITTADASGNFSSKGTLESGSNNITVYTLDQENSKAVQHRTVIVSTADLMSSPNPIAATSSASAKEKK